MATILKLTLHTVTRTKNGETVQETTTDKTFTIGAADQKDTYGSLVSIKVHKEVYTPGYIEAEVQYPFTTAESELKELPGTKVDLTDENDNIVAKDYVILRVVPAYTRNSQNTSLYVRFLIYSPDKLLAHRKYNKCYVARRLGEDILNTITQNDSTKATPICAIDYTHQQHLLLKDGSATSTADGQEKKEGEQGEEFIQPYLVQYDESAHDFLSRIANRCGEFLFYEDGKWQLGINTAASAKTVDTYDSLVFNYTDETTDDFLWANDYTGREPNNPPEKPKNDATQKEKDEYDAQLEAYNAKIKAGIADYKGPLDEYASIYERKVTDSLSNYGESLLKGDNDTVFYKDPAWFVEHITSWLQKDNLANIIATAATDMAKKAIINGLTLDNENKKWNKENIDVYKGKASQCDNSTDPTEVAPYTNYAAVGKYLHGFYASILARGQEAERGACHIEFGTSYTPLNIGDIITVNGAQYVVSHVEFSYSIKATSKRDFNMTVDALPAVDGEWYPAPLKGGTMKRVEPQTAIVTSTSDPLDLGRIQIRYPWQPADEKASLAWIRIAAPFTSKDAAIRFVPQKGDEIMVGYEYGNIERPFMMGAMQSAENNGADDEKYIIKSPNGHYIKFSNPKNAQSLITSTFAPFWKEWTTYVPSLPLPKSTDEWFKGGAGGITMGDKYGFYKISMSTDKRSVSIDSALGKVSLSALTGITISAPNGNIKISGKNVEISAGNNLKITSGGNIKKMNELHQASIATIAGGALISAVTNEAKKLLPKVDLSLLRTVIEALVKPIGGNMLIKSNRFLRLEAGKGKTMLPDDYLLDTDSDKQAKALNKAVSTLHENMAKDTVKQVQDLISTVSRAYTTLVGSLQAHASGYSGAISDMKSEAAADPATLQYDGSHIDPQRHGRQDREGRRHHQRSTQEEARLLAGQPVSRETGQTDLHQPDSQRFFRP